MYGSILWFISCCIPKFSLLLVFNCGHHTWICALASCHIIIFTYIHKLKSWNQSSVNYLWVKLSFHYWRGRFWNNISICETDTPTDSRQALGSLEVSMAGRQTCFPDHMVSIYCSLLSASRLVHVLYYEILNSHKSRFQGNWKFKIQTLYGLVLLGSVPNS